MIKTLNKASVKMVSQEPLKNKLNTKTYNALFQNIQIT